MIRHALAFALGLVLAAPAAIAEEAMSEEEIILKLKPKKLTRSLTGTKGGLSDAQKEKLDGILKRSIGVEEREAVVEIVKDAELPKLDFEIYFEFDSAGIKAESLPVLDQLGKALKNPALAASGYLVNGHTDAKGSDDYNQSLSEERARAVVAYLVEHHGLDGYRLKPIGFGESHLKDKDYPEAAENRRVEVVNLTY